LWNHSTPGGCCQEPPWRDQVVDCVWKGDGSRDIRESPYGCHWGAKDWSKTEVVTLLERFLSDAAQAKDAVRVEVGWYDGLAAEMFALVVFVSDGLLQVKDPTTATPAARFFSIAKRLPLEIQMVLCFRQVGSDKEILPGKDSEVAFKELARKLW